MAKKRRICKWDNIKGILILLVVFGHFASCIKDESAWFGTLYYYVYIFHMPLFIFLSGMFAENSIQRGRKIRSKFIGYLILACGLKLAIMLVKWGFGQEDNFTLSNGWGVAWYLFALAFYILITWALNRVDRRWLCLGSLILALGIGYDPNVTSVFNLSRMFVFYPIFLLGTLWSPDWYRLPDSRYQRIAAIASAIVLAVGFLIVYKYLDRVVPLENLLWGNSPYKKLFHHTTWAWLARLGVYLLAGLLGFCIVSIAPEGRGILTLFGRSSLPIYLSHRLILYVLVYVGYEDLLRSLWSSHWHILFMLTAIPVSLIFALPIFRTLVKRYWKWMEWAE